MITLARARPLEDLRGGSQDYDASRRAASAPSPTRRQRQHEHDLRSRRFACADRDRWRNAARRSPATSATSVRFDEGLPRRRRGPSSRASRLTGRPTQCTRGLDALEDLDEALRRRRCGWSSRKANRNSCRLMSTSRRPVSPLAIPRRDPRAVEDEDVEATRSGTGRVLMVMPAARARGAYLHPTSGPYLLHPGPGFDPPW